MSIKTFNEIEEFCNYLNALPNENPKKRKDNEEKNNNIIAKTKSNTNTKEKSLNNIIITKLTNTK